MSLQSKSKYEELKEQVKIFLANETAQGMLIHGDWGIGKTHFINTIVNDHKMLVDAKLYFYSYVSLYSTSNVGDFKSEIISNKKITKKGILNFLLVKGCQFLKILNFKFSNFGISLSWVLKTKVSKELSRTLIIIDDLERKGKSIDITEALGTLNGMTIANGSKFIVIANINELESDKDKEFLQKNKDKLFSSLIHYKEDIDLSISICEELSKKNSSLLDCFERFSEISKQTNITNIRVLYSILTGLSLFKSKLDTSFENSNVNVNPILINDISEMYFFLGYLFESGLFINKMKSSQVISFIKDAPSLITHDIKRGSGDDAEENDKDDSKSIEVIKVCQRIKVLIEKIQYSNLLIKPIIIEHIMNYIILNNGHSERINDITNCINDIHRQISEKEVYNTIVNVRDNLKSLTNKDKEIIKKIPFHGCISIKDYVFLLPYQYKIMDPTEHDNINMNFIKYIENLGGVDGITSKPYLDNINLNSQSYSFLSKECLFLIENIKNKSYQNIRGKNEIANDSDFNEMYSKLNEIKSDINNKDNYIVDDESFSVLNELFLKCSSVKDEEAQSIIFNNSNLVLNIIYTTEFYKLNKRKDENKKYTKLYDEINNYLLRLIAERIKLEPYQEIRLDKMRDELKPSK